ncbi:HNH endonuclease [Paracoccus aminophilus]|nr:HNH endonuclease signature motif containing protein [Paracoccus aminophilus]
MSRHALYKTARWRSARLAHLRQEPLCRMCQLRGILNDGSRSASGEPQGNPKRRFLVVDHVIPHRGDLVLFWDQSNWQTLCPDHHDVVKQREEVRGFSNARGPDGWPLDPQHPANR